MIRKKLEKKRARSRWERRLLKIVYDLEAEGHPVRFVTERVLQDYGGMNYAAARATGFPWPKGFSKKGYLVSATSTPKTQAKDLHHEHDEYISMTQKGMEYWPAHIQALRSEREVRC